MSVRSRTAGVMTTLMRNGRDRRLGKPVMGHAILERMLLVGTRSADHIRASSHSGCIAMEVTPPFENRPDTWLHPNASQNVRFLLHRGRRPYMAQSRHSSRAQQCPLSGVKRTLTPAPDQGGHRANNDIGDSAVDRDRSCAIGIRPNHANCTGDYANYRRRDQAAECGGDATPF